MTMITQRSASLNKNVLTQVQTLVTFRTTGPQDRAAIELWLKHNDQSAKILAELPKLENGEAWVWSPNFLKETKKVKFPLSRTFDSGATPTGAKRAAATLADVDLHAIEKRMAATVERARAEDPKLLRKRVAELERELTKSTPLSVEVPVFDEGRFAQMEDRLKKEVGTVLHRTALAVQESVDALFDEYRRGLAAVPCKKSNGHLQDLGQHVARAPGVAKFSGGDASLKAMHRAMLTALAQHPGGLTKRQVLIHTSYASSGPVSTAFADLSRAGFVTGRGNLLCITPDGLRALGPFEPLPVGDDLREWLLTGSKLSTMERALLREICKAYPNPILKRAVLERAEYASSGPVSTAFAKLVAYGYALPRGAKRAEILRGAKTTHHYRDEFRVAWERVTETPLPKPPPQKLRKPPPHVAARRLRFAKLKKRRIARARLK